MKILKINPRLTRIFVSDRDYYNYLDYMENGLKIVRQENRATYFNDGSLLTDISLKDETPKRYVLHKNNRTFKDMKYMKQYVELVES
jgi:hypothetical protein